MDEQLKQSNEKAKHDKNEEKYDVRELAKTAFGRRYLWKKVDRCGVFRPSYDHSGSKTYFNEGERNIGLGMFIEWLESEPQSLFEMMLKHLGEKK